MCLNKCENILWVVVILILLFLFKDCFCNICD